MSSLKARDTTVDNRLPEALSRQQYERLLPNFELVCLTPGPDAKEGYTELFFRKGNFVIIMSASTRDSIQRFAKHMADEIPN
jgi:hypothetical protein